MVNSVTELLTLTSGPRGNTYVTAPPVAAPCRVAIIYTVYFHHSGTKKSVLLSHSVPVSLPVSLQNFCVQGLELFASYLFQDILELYDWNLTGRTPDTCAVCESFTQCLWFVRGTQQNNGGGGVFAVFRKSQLGVEPNARIWADLTLC